MPGRLPLALEWFQKGEEDLVSARLLLRHGGPAAVAGSLLQQAVEKYLKGFLLHRGWKLQRTHDLISLLSEAQHYMESLQEFEANCQKITRLYIEERYPPIGRPEVSREEIDALLPVTEELIQRLKVGVENP